MNTTVEPTGQDTAADRIGDATPDAGQGAAPGSPAPQDQDVADLLADAKLVADYGVRSGRFGKDATLFDAIRNAAAQGSALGWTSPENVALQKELGNAIALMRPVTLPELRSGWRLDSAYRPGFRHKALDFLKKGVVVCATAYLLYLCASLTVWQQRAAGLVNEMSVDKVGQQDKAVDELLVLVGSDKLNELANPASPLRETFREKQREIRAIQRSLQAEQMTFERLDEYQSTNAPLFAFFEKTGASVGALLARSAPEPKQPHDAPEVRTPADAEGVIRAAVVTPSGSIAVNAVRQPSAPGTDLDCNSINAQYRIDRSNASLNGSSEPNAVRSVRMFMSALDFDDAFKSRIMCGLGVATPAAGYTAAHTAFDIEYRLKIMSLWWLPALYGALGALIYHMREFLSGVRPDPSLMKLLVRVGLSAFAGIAIGWFWIPEDASVLGVSEVPIAPLTIAFLVGFAIDSFVALLDRIADSLTRALSGTAAPPQQPPGTR